MEKFNAYMIEETEDGVTGAIKTISLDELPQDDVLIKVAYSSVNYKDALASKKSTGVIQKYPMIPGVDLSGTVVSSKSDQFKEKDEVLVTGYGMGVAHYGGYAEYACVPSEWIVKLPHNMSLKEAMILGTAGFTAGISISELEKNGMSPQDNPIILITGASGGVGNFAIMYLKAKGYQNIIALTRKEDQNEYLTKIGASELLMASEVMLEKVKPLARQKFDYVIDTVGGEQLANIIPQINYNGAIALCGNAGGVNFTTTVLPFILRGVKILGIDSVSYPMDKRLNIWNDINKTMDKLDLSLLVNKEINFEQLTDTFDELLAGKHAKRTIVKFDK